MKKPAIPRPRAQLSPVREVELSADELVESAEPPPVPSSRIVPKPIVVISVPPIEALAEEPLPPPAPLPVIETPLVAPPLAELRPATLIESFVEPTEVLFEGMWELETVQSSWQAASVCASALGRALRARAVVVHTHDLASRELRAVGVHGDEAFDVLGQPAASDDDLVASAIICNQKPVTMRFDGELPRLAPRRLEMLGAPRTLVAIPAMRWGRCVAMIEVVDADERYASRVIDAATYVADRLADVLAGRLAA